MNVSRSAAEKYVGFSVVGVLLVAMILVPMSTNSVVQVAAPENLFAPGNVWVTVTRTNGSISQVFVHNSVVDGARKRIRDFLLGSAADSQNLTVYISWSNDSLPQMSWAKLPGELLVDGFKRAAGNFTRLNGTAYKVFGVFTATGNISIQCAGLSSDPTPGGTGLFAIVTFHLQNLRKGDQVQITWVPNLTELPGA